MITPGVSKHLLYDFVASLGNADCHIALLTSGASYGPSSATFEGAGEIKAQGYATGGKRLNNFSCGLDDGIAWAAWGNAEWQNASIKACGAVIYEKANGNRIVTVLDFGDEQVSSQGLFRVRMPAPGASNAVFWLA
jgi:hypothetical protein